MENTKSISQLEKDLSTMVEESKIIACNLGEKLLSDNVNSNSENILIDESKFKEWKILKNDRQIVTEKIIEIKHISTRLEELKHFLSDANKKTKEQSGKLSKVQSDFVIEYYKRFKGRAFPFFKNLHEKGSGLEAELSKSIRALNKINDTLKDSSVLTKMSLTPKMLKARIKKRNAEININKFFKKNASQVFQDSKFKDAINQSLPDDLLDMYKKINTVYKIKYESDIKLENIYKEIKELESKLCAICNTDKPSQKIIFYTKEMQKCDSSIDKITEDIANKYINDFVNDDGRLIKEFTDEDEVLYKDEIIEFSTKMQSIFKLKNIIKYKHVLKDIERCDTAIFSTEKNVSKCKEAIILQEKNIVQLSQSLEEKKYERKQLQNDLENLISKI